MEKMDKNQPMTHDRISLWKLDQLIQGSLAESEAAQLREAISKSPEAQAYLKKNSALRSGLRLEAILKARNQGANKFIPQWIRVFKSFIGDAFSGKGMLTLRLAGVVGLALGLGVWTFNMQEANERPSTYQPKGLDAAGIRLQIQGDQYEAGQLAQARIGDTLGISYRTQVPIYTQIWYREERGEVHPMAGASGGLIWDASTRWRMAPQKIVLEGEWQRQTVWVVWSHHPFTSAEVEKKLQNSTAQSDHSQDTLLHVEAFRLVKPQP